MTQDDTPSGVPQRFSADGVVQYCPGNTTLCHIPLDSPLIPVLKKIYEAIKSHPVLSVPIHLLPQDSWHMTTCDGVIKYGYWPPGRSEKDLQEFTEEVRERMKALGEKLEGEGLASPYHIRGRGFDACVNGIALEVEGATEEEERRLRRLRDTLADAFGFKQPTHDTYTFHVSIAYLLRFLEDEERQELNKLLSRFLDDIKVEFQLGDVEFCTFDNMHKFDRLFYLGMTGE
ncbi:uncharacterized protein MYCFIDRAFT_211195 [Pseudocercospora fijiensis CIRAD86]|uniref:DUF1868 domain-containing protein n=1 Tax=Pseudocercospora fijiensis (strain CIRAD86) TaxID=383855 RepID=M3B0H5_PSEFD|nr:uncharacterized protein MYCFIDRAFT_211195 [Pseudocercospora fijiensis CIRAD86]EME82913.1 hypothetical protein MYCFIDRAFT_211195 [Pseudocercospora fijiensis CIRAD86]